MISGYVMCGVLLGILVLASTANVVKIFPQDVQFNLSTGSCVLVHVDHPHISNADWNRVTSDIRSNQGNTNVVVHRMKEDGNNEFEGIEATSGFFNHEYDWFEMTWKNNPSGMSKVYAIDGSPPKKEITFDLLSKDFAVQSLLGLAIMVILVGLVAITSGCYVDYCVPSNHGRR